MYKEIGFELLSLSGNSDSIILKLPNLLHLLKKESKFQQTASKMLL